MLAANNMPKEDPSDFAPGQLLHSAKPISVYMRWKEQDLLALSPLVRLLWGSLIDSLTTTYDAAQGKRCHPVLLLIDEAGRTAIPSLEPIPIGHIAPE